MTRRRRAQRDPFETGISPTERKLYENEDIMQKTLNAIARKIGEFEEEMMRDDDAIYRVDDFLEELREIVDEHRR